jgi:hypothetical protein
MCDNNNRQKLHTDKRTVGHDNCQPDVGDGGFPVSHATIRPKHP